MKKRVQQIRLCLVLVLAVALAAGCASEEMPPKQENPNRYEWGELAVELPEDDAELLTVEWQDGSAYGALLTVWETASLERARADGLADPKAEGWGWICTLVAYDRKQVEENLMGDAPGLEYIGKDDTHWYGISCPTDVRLYTSDGVYGGDSLKNWERANQVTDQIMKDFVSRNDLTPWSMAEVYGGSWHLYDGEHREYLWTPDADPEMNEMRLILAQPARQGEGGIWCVERFTYTGGYGSGFYIPDSPGMTAEAYYEGVQKEHDAGTRTDHATPEAAVEVFLRENLYMSPQTLEEGTLTLQ